MTVKAATAAPKRKVKKRKTPANGEPSAKLKAHLQHIEEEEEEKEEEKEKKEEEEKEKKKEEKEKPKEIIITAIRIVRRY